MHSRENKKLHIYQSKNDVDKFANAFDILRKDAKSTVKNIDLDEVKLKWIRENSLS